MIAGARAGVVSVERGSRASLLLALALAVGASPALRGDTPADAVAVTLEAPPTEAAQIAFLRSANVIASRPIGKGVTGALRLTLSDGRLTHDASFQAVDQRTTPEDLAAGRARPGERFVDTYRYNLAAYAVARLLGLGPMMPATVERTIDGRTGALSWWLDDVAMDEEAREKAGNQSPDPLAFSRKRQQMFVFAALVHDSDRNKGNVLYTRNWDVLMIDFTRAFRLGRSFRDPEQLKNCDRQLLARLRALSADDLAKVAGAWLSAEERHSVMARRDLLVARFDALVRERGEKAVLY